jgi:hypothetical protein
MSSAFTAAATLAGCFLVDLLLMILITTLSYGATVEPVVLRSEQLDKLLNLLLILCWSVLSQQKQELQCMMLSRLLLMVNHSCSSV